MKPKEYKPKKDKITTIAGAVAAGATAAQPFFPQYSMQIAAAQAISMALWAYFSKDKEKE
jgi:hypothetical protein